MEFNEWGNDAHSDHEDEDGYDDKYDYDQNDEDDDDDDDVCWLMNRGNTLFLSAEVSKHRRLNDCIVTIRQKHIEPGLTW